MTEPVTYYTFKLDETTEDFKFAVTGDCDSAVVEILIRTGTEFKKR